MASIQMWTIEFDLVARRELDKLDKPIANRILKFLYQRIARLESPQQVGEKLQGALSAYWKYRVGDYRIICSIEHDRLVVLVLRVGHRSQIYSR
jgi:mRNA interferase RelE/StbE